MKEVPYFACADPFISSTVPKIKYMYTFMSHIDPSQMFILSEREIKLHSKAK